MKKLAIILAGILTCSSALALVNNIREEDGDPSLYPWQLKFTNGSVTDNGDNTASINVVVGGGDATFTAITLTGFDCTGNSNGGALTADANGVVACSDDDAAASGSSEWTDTGSFLHPNETADGVLVGGATVAAATIFLDAGAGGVTATDATFANIGRLTAGQATFTDIEATGTIHNTQIGRYGATDASFTAIQATEIGNISPGDSTFTGLHVSLNNNGNFVTVTDANESDEERVRLGNRTLGPIGGYVQVFDDSEASTAIIRSYALLGVQAYFTAGNVGIGATSASKELDVTGEGNFSVGMTAVDGTFTHIGRSTPGDATFTDLRVNNGLNFTQIGNQSATDATFTDLNVTNQFTGKIGGTTANDATFTSVYSSGNVGIGVATPQRILDIGVDTTTTQWSDTGDSNNPRVRIGDASGGGGYIQLFDDAENIDTLIRSYQISGTEAYFNGGGNIGIGVTAPEKKLHVAGTLTATDATFNSINNARIGNTSASDATFTDVTVSSLTVSQCVQTDGNGILTSSGGACGGAGNPAGNNQDVQINASGSFGADTGFAYNSTTNTLTAVNATFTNIDEAKIGETTADDATFTTVRVDNLTSNTTLTLDKDAGTDAEILFTNTGTIGPRIRYDSSLEHLFVEHDELDKDIVFKVNDGGVDTEMMRIDGSSSKVGIGTSNPTFLLDVESANQNTIASFITAVNNLRIQMSDDDTTGFIGVGGTSQFWGEGSGPDTQGIVIDVDGNVGMGDITPDAKLDIVGNMLVSDSATFVNIEVSGTIHDSKIGVYGAKDATFTDVTVTSLSASECVETNANGILTSSGAACGGGADTNAFMMVDIGPLSTGDATFNGITAAAPIVYDEDATVAIHAIAFDATNDECRSIKQFVVPPDIDTSGTVTFRVYGYAATASTNTVAMYFSHRPIDTAENYDGTLTTEADTATAQSGTQDVVTELNWTETVTNLAWTANDYITGYICRDPDTDSLASDYHMVAGAIEIPRA